MNRSLLLLAGLALLLSACDGTDPVDPVVVQTATVAELAADPPGAVVLTGELTIIITARRMPAFVQLVEFDPLDGLIVADVRALLHARGIDLTDDQAAQLHQLTGGNAEFVTLAIGALLAGQGVDDLFGRMAASDDVRRYLIANVNQFLNLEERRVMEAVAVLSGYPGARDVIEYLLDGVNV